MTERWTQGSFSHVKVDIFGLCVTVWCGWRALPRGKKGNNDSLTHRSSPYPRCDPTPDRLVRLCSSGGRARPRQFCLGRVVPERPVLAKQGRVAERRALCGLCRRAGRRGPWALSPVPWMTRAGRPMPDPCQQGWVGGTKSIAVFGRAPRCDFPAIPLAPYLFSFDSVARPILGRCCSQCFCMSRLSSGWSKVSLRAVLLIRVQVSELLALASTRLRESHVGCPPG